MPRKKMPPPFTTATVLRGIELAISIAEAHAARDLVGYVAPISSITDSNARDLARARAWLEHAKETRKGSR